MSRSVWLFHKFFFYIFLDWVITKKTKNTNRLVYLFEFLSDQEDAVIHSAKNSMQTPVSRLYMKESPSESRKHFCFVIGISLCFTGIVFLLYIFHTAF